MRRLICTLAVLLATSAVVRAQAETDTITLSPVTPDDGYILPLAPAPAPDPAPIITIIDNDWQQRLLSLSEGLLVTAHALDLVETIVCRLEHRCIEANPWLMRFTSPAGFTLAKMPIAYAGIALTRKYSHDHMGRAIWLNVGQSAAFGSLASRAYWANRPKS